MNFESCRNLSSHSRFGAAKVREAINAENDDLRRGNGIYWSAGENWVIVSQDKFVTVGEILINLKLREIIE